MFYLHIRLNGIDLYGVKCYPESLTFYQISKCKGEWAWNINIQKLI
ncbi:hypothetical protein BN173_3610001 [Clostridioides difficile T11]|nr:hypothetical protein BN173_3610001 [Clostridioides difficile T11]